MEDQRVVKEVDASPIIEALADSYIECKSGGERERLAVLICRLAHIIVPEPFVTNFIGDVILVAGRKLNKKGA